MSRSKRHPIQIPEGSHGRLIREQQNIPANAEWYERIVRPMNFTDWEEDIYDPDRDYDEDRPY